MKTIATTSYNSVFVVRFAHSNTFDTSQTRKTLNAISSLISEQCVGVKEWRFKCEKIIENSFQSIK